LYELIVVVEFVAGDVGEDLQDAFGGGCGAGA